MLLFWWVDGGREGDLAPAGIVGVVASGSLFVDVMDRRRSLMKSLTTLKDERREVLLFPRSFECDRRDSREMRRSCIVSLVPSSAAMASAGPETGDVAGSAG